MLATVKPVSIRCDMHPPMSASMYCEHCNTFLCKLCVDIKPGGRFCTTCKRLCLQPSAEQLAELLEARARTRMDAKNIKAAAEKQKLDREAKLKADFAAQKSAWTQKQSTQQNALAAGSASGATTASQAPQPAAIHDEKDVALRNTLRSDDGLSKLGERAYMNVIGKAQNYMLLIGVLTLLFNGGVMWWISDAEQQSDNRIEVIRQETIERITSEIKVAKTTDQRKQLEMKRSMAETGQNIASSIGHGLFFIVKAVVGCYLAIGALLLGLYFVCETYPRGATMTAFIVYLLANFVDLIFIRSGGILGLFVRWGALVALYNGMQAGQTLYRMRVESGEYLGDKAAG